MAAAPPHDAESRFRAARELATQGRLAEARDALLALRTSLPATTPMLEACLADVLARNGDLDGAIASARTAVSLAPGMVEANLLLAALLDQAGDPNAARSALHEVLARGSDARLSLHLAQIEIFLGDGSAALRALQAAELAPPADARTALGLAKEYLALQEPAGAERVLSRAFGQDPANARGRGLWAVALQELGDTTAALHALEPARRIHPGDLSLAIHDHLMLPQVPRSIDDVRRWRERYRDGLSRLAADAGRWRATPGAVFGVEHNNFLLAYQGEDDLALQKDYSRLLGTLAADVHPEWREPRKTAFDGGRRLRVGFVGSVLRDTSAGRLFERWITGLDRERFAIHAYATPQAPDALTARIAAVSDKFAVLPSHCEQAAALIAGDALDVVVHPEVGMHDMSYVLAALRLAPVQAAGWGHPVTTGSDAIDWFITCGAMEPADAQSHYTERLLRLPGPGVNCPLPAATVRATRSELGLPQGRLYACPQSLFKLHPEMDSLLADILLADPEGILVFFQSGVRAITQQFVERLGLAFAARGIAPRSQVKVLPRIKREAFRQVLASCDVVLDTVRWSGGLTSLDALAAGVPVVTLPGRFMRGRQTAGMLALMGIEGLTARSGPEYVRLAVDTALDRDRNMGLREAIASMLDALYERPEPIGALADALLRIGAGQVPG